MFPTGFCPLTGRLKVGSEDGIAAVEYRLLAALIAVVIITAVTLLGTNLTGVFNAAATSVHS